MLRAEFPNLVTQIFETSPDRFEIVFDAQLQEASEIAEAFERLRYASLHVRLANDPPADYLREINPISDSAPVDGFSGLPFRRFDIFNLLIGRFPHLPIRNVRESETGALAVVVEGRLQPASQAELLRFLQRLGLPKPWQIEVAHAPNGPPRYPGDDRLFILAAKSRGAPSFVERDEAFWFEQVEAAASGALLLEDFPGVEPNLSACYIDCTFGTQINLRQALLLFDVIYIAPPLAEHHQTFLAAQVLSEQDLLELIGTGRLRLALIQPEEELSLRFLEAAAERRPDAILGRRTIAALLLADVARTAEDYRLNDQALQPVLTHLCSVLAPALRLEKDELLRALLWPLSARRGAVLGLLDGASKRGPALQLGTLLSSKIKASLGRDVALEAIVLSERVHIGHSLNATVFPALDEPNGYSVLMRAMGSELNMYRSFNTRLAAAWAANQERKANGISIMPPVPLFQFDTGVPIAELLADTMLPSTRATGLALFSRMAELSLEERNAEVRRLNEALRAKSRPAGGKLISFDNADTGLAIASVIFGFLYPPIAGMKNLAKQVTDRIRNIPQFDSFLDGLEQDTLRLAGRNQDLHFLSRIDRVASFKVDRVA